MAGISGPGNCTICNHQNRKEFELRIARGDHFQAIADLAGCTHVAIRNHFTNNHCELNILEFREWMQQNGSTPVQLEKRRETFLEKVLAQPEEINQQMVSATLLMCANEAHEILQLMKEKEDYRGSIAAIEALRRTTMDLTTLHSLKTDSKQQETIDDSVDVQALRESILEAVRQRRGDTPGQITHHPLR